MTSQEILQRLLNENCFYNNKLMIFPDWFTGEMMLQLIECGLLKTVTYKNMYSHMDIFIEEPKNKLLPFGDLKDYQIFNLNGVLLVKYPTTKIKKYSMSYTVNAVTKESDNWSFIDNDIIVELID